MIDPIRTFSMPDGRPIPWGVIRAFQPLLDGKNAVCTFPDGTSRTGTLTFGSTILRIATPDIEYYMSMDNDNFMAPVRIEVQE